MVLSVQEDVYSHILHERLKHLRILVSWNQFLVKQNCTKNVEKQSIKRFKILENIHLVHEKTGKIKGRTKKKKKNEAYRKQKE